MKINFYGAAEEVTGSKHLLTLKNGKKLLLDCGFFQGRGKESAERNQHFDFDPSSIDYLVLSHAHIDHSGNIPTLVKKGFRGRIFCTPATLDLCEIMLADSAYIQESDIAYINRRRASRGQEALEPLYSLKDVDDCWKYFETVPYKKPFKIDEDVTLRFTDAGHILGAAVVNLTIHEGSSKTRLAFTGDIGRFINKILYRPQPFPQADVVICESTYGDRLHESVKEAQDKLYQAVRETCYEKKGKLIIPAFSIGKTQELVFTLNKLELEGKLPSIKVFVDSPLAISATEIMKRHPECYGKSTQRFLKKDPDPFGFERLFYVRDVEDSKAINRLDEPCIVISASGMADAGRVKHHLANSLEDKRNSVLIIGYSEPSSLSGRLLRGDAKVSIFGKMHDVNADIYNIDFFSAHADQNELLQFLSYQNQELIEQIFLVHGDQDALIAFKELLEDKGYPQVTIAERARSYYI